jgi:hypothetical protein
MGAKSEFLHQLMHTTFYLLQSTYHLEFPILL